MWGWLSEGSHALERLMRPQQVLAVSLPAVRQKAVCCSRAFFRYEPTRITPKLILKDEEEAVEADTMTLAAIVSKDNGLVSPHQATDKKQSRSCVNSSTSYVSPIGSYGRGSGRRRFPCTLVDGAYPVLEAHAVPLHIQRPDYAYRTDGIPSEGSIESDFDHEKCEEQGSPQSPSAFSSASIPHGTSSSCCNSASHRCEGVCKYDSRLRKYDGFYVLELPRVSLYSASQQTTSFHSDGDPTVVGNKHPPHYRRANEATKTGSSGLCQAEPASSRSRDHAEASAITLSSHYRSSSSSDPKHSGHRSAAASLVIPQTVSAITSCRSSSHCLALSFSSYLSPSRQRHLARLLEAAQLAAQCLSLALSNALPGTSNETMDKLVHEHILRHNAYPAAINFHGFPKSVCASTNEVACHGLPTSRPLQEGDLVSYDCTVFKNGVFGDCCGTVLVGENDARPDQLSAEAEGTEQSSEDPPECKRGQLMPPLAEDSIRQSSQATSDPAATAAATPANLLKTNDRRHTHRALNRCTYTCMIKAIEALGPGLPLNTVGKTISTFMQSQYPFFSVVEDFCGHFIGERMHQLPLVSHTYHPARGQKSQEYVLKEGDVFTVEPIVCEGSPRLKTWTDGWSMATRDNGWAAQWEHTVVITKNGAEVLSQLAS